MLVHDTRSGAAGMSVGFLLTFVEKYTGSAVDWDEIGGGRSALVVHDLLEVDEQGPLLERQVRLRPDAAGELLTGTRGSKSAGEGRDNERLHAWERIQPNTKLVNAVLPPDLFDELTEALMAIRSQHEMAAMWGVHQASHEGDGFILLFEGVPGTGKTYTAEAVAHSLGRPLFRARLDQLFSKWVGQTEKAIAALFREAEEEGAVVLLDEADALLGARDNGRLNFEISQVKVLLQELERFPGVVILTTNRPHALDPALERRLAARLIFTPPGHRERERLWRVHLPSKAIVARDIEFSSLGERFDLNGSQIRAARVAFRRLGKDKVIRQEDLEVAARRVARKETAPPSVSTSRRGARKPVAGPPRSKYSHPPFKSQLGRVLSVGRSQIEGCAERVAVSQGRRAI